MEKKKSKFSSKFSSELDSKFGSKIGKYDGDDGTVTIELPAGLTYLTFNGLYVTTDSGAYIVLD